MAPYSNLCALSRLDLPEIDLKSLLEHTSCACVARFARFALTQAGSYKENQWSLTSKEMTAKGSKNFQ